MAHNKNIINGILDKYEQERLNGGELNYFSLEHELRDTLNIGYQEIKPIINDMFNQGLYREICYGYAKAFQTIEFNQLIKRYELQNK
jgi:hypothetical protein